MTDRLYYGDNLEVLRGFADASVDLMIEGHPLRLPPLVSPVKKAQRVETRASHQKGAQGELL